MSTRPGSTAPFVTTSLLTRAPEVTLCFWIIKILATMVGETATDFLDTAFGFGLTGTSVVMTALLAGVLVAQFRARCYVPSIYWTAVVLISVFGTLITDDLTDVEGVPLPVTTAVFAVALVGTFLAWYAKEGTLSIHTIFTARREAFSWLAILVTFALGTAVGDLVAKTLAIGYAESAALFAALIALTSAAHRALELAAVPAFWIAYILTQPLGASLGDLLSQDRIDGGLGLGTTVTSGTLLLAILGLVAFLDRAGADRTPRGAVSEDLARD